MLALGGDHGKRGGNVVAGKTTATTAAWPITREPGVNIKQKISQWEGLSQQEDVPSWNIKPQRTLASRRLSGDLLGNGLDGNDGGCNKATLSKAKNLGLDFRENQMTFRPVTGELQSDFPRNRTHSNKLVTSTPVTKPLSTVTQVQDAKLNVKSNNIKTNHFTDVEITSLPRCVEDPEASLPPGNFYTSRGFWKRLETDDSFWEKEKDSLMVTKGLGEIRPLSPPPKPQRTFQYKGASSPPGQWIPLENQTPSVSKSNLVRKHDIILKPPSCPPPPCPVNTINGFSRNRKNRKSFEFEDVVRRTAQQASKGKEGLRSGLYHAWSEDSIYEDISDISKENPYEDLKLSPMCLPIRRPRNYTVGQRESPHIKISPKPFTLLPNADRLHKMGRDRKESITSPTRTCTTNSPKTSTAAKPATSYRTNRQPPLVNRIQEIFEAKRGRKRVWATATRDELSGTESDPEESSKDRSQRTVYVQSTLKRRPGYHTLERDLIQLQEQQLFQQFVVVSLRKASPGNTYIPEITQQFPTKFEKSSRLSREAEDRLKAIPKFCFPDCQDWRPSSDHNSETFSFVLTGEDGSRLFGYCRKILPSGKGKRLPEVHCIISRLGCFNLFSKILEEVERRREISPALVHPFMHSVMEAPFPAPGRTITVKSFLPGSGNEVLTLCRPVDSRLEHVDFESLLQCLSVTRLLQVFASLLLERRVIFIADKLSVLSRCAHSALALLYPFTWQHTFVPVLPASMLDICCSPTPFVLGALSPSLPEVLDMPIEEVLIVDLCADKFVVQLGDEDCILPGKLQAALQEILENREEILEQNTRDRKGDKSDLSTLVSEAFVWFFVELVGHYSLYMSDTGPRGTRELQSDAFRKSHPSRGVRQFLQLFMDTQMFAGFIHDRELRKGGVKGLFELRAAEYLDSYPEPEPSGVNKFLKGLGNKMKFLQKK
ncbi:DENN domain-containing protein 2C-like isoform X1 [Carassius carassius]|uniref:DENN domain-containing protein 2C-like isoform X1 n=1 Tax=Carassius carassius TaxID=217509 RepID=UPI00286926F0|nr:DENN domain-containing protein 2C-like isoform X1 [Carassius carassius]XP_059360095.1 DENN domain-containing protein 2C-like isoform X1 [Carassius carassius]XP_059360096.1 DENN domain-containing protein 2C-like isoform X1 [Carassius carassius]XP_059360097.1 DENN domain-containing protein 2C-like isoform X1 [Carassius carassius]